MFRERVEYIDDGVKNKTGNNEGIKRTKSFTFNLNHKYSTHNKVKLEMRAKDLPFKILKATAFLRNSKTIKHGQKMDLEDLKQLELRLDTTKPVPVPKHLKFVILPEAAISDADMAKIALKFKIRRERKR